MERRWVGRTSEKVGGKVWLRMMCNVSLEKNPPFVSRDLSFLSFERKRKLKSLVYWIARIFLHFFTFFFSLYLVSKMRDVY